MTVHYVDPWNARTYSTSYLQMCSELDVGPSNFRGYQLSFLVAN
jgi:hypothetical protein